MLSKADRVKGQGVGSAYLEQIDLLRKYAPDLELHINSWKPADLVHIHSINPEFRIQAALTRAPKLGSVHFLPETLDGSIKLPPPARKAFDWYVMNFYRAMDHLVTVNPVFVNKLIAAGFAEEKLHYIPNSVSPDIFHPATETERQATRKAHRIPADKFTVLGAGQVQTRKGIADFAAVARALPELQFVWAGGFSFGKITDGYQQLQKLVENPPPNLVFTGIVDRENMPGLYAAADVMFLPSHSELFPMTILEAAACETPILLRDLDLYPAILGQDYLKGADVEQFAAAIQTLANHPEEYERQRNVARRIKAQYSPQTVARQWQELYLEIINQGGKA